MEREGEVGVGEVRGGLGEVRGGLGEEGGEERGEMVGGGER